MATEQPIPILDDVGRMQAVDKRNLLRLINELPEQCETALGIGRNFAVEPLAAKPNAVFITGVGESGTASDMLASVLSEELDIPVISDYSGRLPHYVGEESLVLVADYTGKSAATLRIYKEARQRNAAIICITSGGKLLETASKDGTKIIKIPPGQPNRSAIGYLFVPLMVAVEKCGLVRGMSEKVSSGILLMKNARESLRFENPTTRNIAKQTALNIADRLPVIYGAPGIRSAVALRWKNQLNANSKTAAFSGMFPNALTSDVAGWERIDQMCERIAIIFLREPNDKTENTELMNLTKELLGKFTAIDVDLKGSTTIEKLLYGVYMADYVSYYLALIYEVNPVISDNIAYVESRLAGEEPAAS